ncbi:hypothetical protein, partial [Desulfobacter sp.]|uniref:hypothetical protein n=1 Tax=Desulfobacter sp. TaxID=2294 RepID=UPI003D0B2DCC
MSLAISDGILKNSFCLHVSNKDTLIPDNSGFRQKNTMPKFSSHLESYDIHSASEYYDQAFSRNI